METKERKTGGEKQTRKSGKNNKTRTAEEEARRREEIKEKLREKLELEKRALKVVERLLEDSVTEEFLVDCAHFITAVNYKDTVEERSIVKLCGYPICPNKLGKLPKQQFKISTKTNKVYDITERKCFCSNFCYKASKTFELQISKTPLWLRDHESPEEIKLLKKGDCGSSGEEVLLTESRLQQDDIENPQASGPGGPLSSQQSSAGDNPNDSLSDGELDQDFISSVVSQQQKPRVHWGDPQNQTDEDKEREREKRKKASQDYQEKKTEERQGQTRVDEEGKEPRECETEVRTDAEKVIQLHKANPEQADWRSQDPDVEEVTLQTNLCSLIETEIKPLTSSTQPNPSSHSVPSPSVHISQVGMSRRGAADLRDLLRNHPDQAKPKSLRLNLLEHLKKTLKDWCSDETLKFLYGSDPLPGSPFAEVEEEEEELDEDDLEDDGTALQSKEVEKPSAAAPDYESLQRTTEQQDLRVREFYKGTWILPQEQETNQESERVEDRRAPSLPLSDSQAPHLIQKRITVEKLSSCLRNIVGPLHLTMSDVSSHLNNLVRTFRLNNKNIIHKTPEWTLIAVVLLHLLSEVSPLVRAALETSASVDYLSTLMKELGLQEQDLLNLVHLFKPSTH